MKRLALALLGFAGSISAQSAAVQYLDQQAPYANPIPSILTVQSGPKLGTRFRVSITRHPAPTQTVLGTGVQNVQIDMRILTGNQTWDGYLFLFPDILDFIPAGTGQHIVEFLVPNDQSLIGFRFYQQVIVARPGIQGWRLSRGVRGTIGN